MEKSHFKDDLCYRLQIQPGVPSNGLVCPVDCGHGSSFREDHFKQEGITFGRHICRLKTLLSGIVVADFVILHTSKCLCPANYIPSKEILAERIKGDSGLLTEMMSFFFSMFSELPLWLLYKYLSFFFIVFHWVPSATKNWAQKSP